MDMQLYMARCRHDEILFTPPHFQIAIAETVYIFFLVILVNLKLHLSHKAKSKFMRKFLSVI